MDSGNQRPAHLRPRKYPALTLAQLKQWVDDYHAGNLPWAPEGHHAASLPGIMEEIAARESGASKHWVVPQMK